MPADCVVSLDAFSCGGQRLAIVVVVRRQGRAGSKDDQNQQTGHEVDHRTAHDPDARPPPEPARQVPSRPGPTPASRQSQQRRKKGQCARAADDDGRGQGDTDGREDRQFGEDHADERHRDGGGGSGDDFAYRGQRVAHGRIGVRAHPQIVVIPADEEYRIIGAGAGEHGGQQHDGLGGHAQAERAHTGHDSLGRHQGHPDGDQRQNHREQVAVHHEQNCQQCQHRGDLDGGDVPVAEVLDVVEGAGRPGGGRLQRGAGHGVLHGVNGALCRGDRFGGRHFADDIDRQQPGLVVLACQNFAQRWRGDEVLQCRDVLGLGT